MPNKSQTHVILIGLRCSGKTTTGKMVAKQQNLPFVDLDDLTRARFTESSVAEIWESHGESGWRKEEIAALKDALNSGYGVLALGGGTPMIPEAFKMLAPLQEHPNTYLIYLCAKAETLRSRLLKETGDRPSLTGKLPTEEVAEILTLREPTFRKLATIEIDTEGKSVEGVAELILQEIK